MTFRTLPAHLSPVLVLLTLTVACGGETVETLGGAGSSTGSRGSNATSRVSGSSTGGSGATSSGIESGSLDSNNTSTASGTITSASVSVTSMSGGACVDITVSAAQQACKSASDCDLATTGQVCTGQCDCGDTPVNNAAASQIASELQGLDLAECPCAVAGQPACIKGECTLCGGPDSPPECEGPDGGVSPPKTCVDIDPSSYSTACNEVSDCSMIPGGTLCSGADACAFCARYPVGASGMAQYEQAIAGITFTGACACPGTPAPSCTMGQCVLADAGF